MRKRQSMSRVPECGCQCHKVHVAGEEPFCIGCDNDYSNLCSGKDDYFDDGTEDWHGYDPDHEFKEWGF